LLLRLLGHSALSLVNREIESILIARRIEFKGERAIGRNFRLLFGNHQFPCWHGGLNSSCNNRQWDRGVGSVEMAKRGFAFAFTVRAIRETGEKRCNKLQRNVHKNQKLLVSVESGGRRDQGHFTARQSRIQDMSRAEAAESNCELCASARD
jgi:hypothetical protein